MQAWRWVELVLRKYPWAITLAALIPCAYFDAAGVNHLVASSLFRADVDTLTQASAPRFGDAGASTPTTHHVRDPDQILARDIFDADAGCLNCEAPPVSDGGTMVAETDGGLPVIDMSTWPEPCDGQSKVTGGVVIEDPYWSFAFVQGGGHDATTLPYRVGQTLEGKMVSLVGWDEERGSFLWLRQGTNRCYYAQYMPPRPEHAPAAEEPHPHPHDTGGMSTELAAALDQGITRAGANEFNVQRGLVDRILENQAELMRTTRIMPQTVDGRIVGVQLFGVRPSSLLGRLGMQNGDTLNRINGLDISTPDRALEAYSRLRTADRISLSVTRNNQPVNIDFNIH